jgi:glycerol-3-phosphate cytidylyltransferase
MASDISSWNEGVNMNKIVTTEEAIALSNKLQKEGKKIVLAGGCFDILHIGHLIFLEKAKKEGDILFVMIEHDESIKQAKGVHRPVNTQHDRARILAALMPVDYVILLPPLLNDALYDDLVIRLKPAIIATTEGDKNRFHKERQANRIGAKITTVTAAIHNQSTTRLIEFLKKL